MGLMKIKNTRNKLLAGWSESPLREDPRALYAKSYLTIRRVVGGLGIMLPFMLILIEAYLLEAPVNVRGSISAYYHSPARDLLVACLCVTGFLLITYMSAQKRSLEFLLSTVAGTAVIGVAFFPTMRPGLVPADVRCGVTPVPAGCSPVQQHLGETATATIHFTCAVTFVLSLAAIALLFAYLELPGSGPRTVRFRVQRTCALLILLAVVGVAIGEFLNVRFGSLTPIYLGEVVSVFAFGVSWLLAARDPDPGSHPDVEAVPAAA